MSAPISAISGKTLQLGVETTEGTSVSAGKKLQAISFNLSPHIDTQEFSPQGNFFPTAYIPTQDYTEGDIDGIGAYNDLTYLFASLLSYAAPVQIGSTTGYTHTFEPSLAAANTHKTYTVEQGGTGSGNARKATGVYVNEVSLDISRADGITVGGSVMGRNYQTGITLTSTPTLIPFVPILPTQIDIFLDDTWAALGTTQLLDSVTASFGFGNRFTPQWVLNSALASFASKVNAKPDTSVALKMAANSVGYAYLATLRAAGTKFLRIKATGATFDTLATYTFQIDAALQYTDAAGEDEDNDALVIEAPMALVADATSGHTLQVKLINTLSAL
jgi:hypothetical protein